MTNLLSAICSGVIDSFALISRANHAGVEVLVGDVGECQTLREIPLLATGSGSQILAAVPFRQIHERGFDCHDDGAPLRYLTIRDREIIALSTATTLLPTDGLHVTESGFATPDETYAGIVASVIESEIAAGAGANFVIRRDYIGRFTGGHIQAALTLLARLLHHESGAYWTFAFVTPEMALVGATPERHVSVSGGEVLMNPISGTYRHSSNDVGAEGLLRFLADPKETDELFMVVDEELKMMATVCERGGQVLGPYLKQMGHLTHTEYMLQGRTTMDVRDILRDTMFAPTVTGSPVRNATRIIKRYEDGGRGYYSGVLALLGHDDQGQTLDAPILIRTCELSPDGGLKMSVGATLVRDSDPDSEVAETHSKLGGLRQALGEPGPATHRVDLSDPRVEPALSARNATLAAFWTQRQTPASMVKLPTRVLLINAEDEWTAMLAHQVRCLGMRAEICNWNQIPSIPSADIVVAGPGPGNPTQASDPRIGALRHLIRTRRANQQPLIAVCLSHQILAGELGLPIVKLNRPNQGTQLSIDLFGQHELAAFYNSFAATLPKAATLDDQIEVAAEAKSGVVHALKGPAFASIQFHPESILTTNGTTVLHNLLNHALHSQTGRRAATRP